MHIDSENNESITHFDDANEKCFIYNVKIKIHSEMMLKKLIKD
jgi:hypothetical protein